MIIGIDVGISTTKIVGLKDGKVISPMRIRATDPVTSLYGAFGKFLYDNKIELFDVKQVMLTGAGSAYVNEPIYGLPTDKADEFLSNGLGARYETQLEKMIVVSMGTGTSYVKCQGDDIHNICGLAMGGGTLQGLSRMLLKTSDIKHVVHLAEKGDESNVNLLIGDITQMPLPGLPPSATASLLGKAQSNTSEEDMALGIICTVLQTIGSAAILASIGTGIKDIVFIGNLTLLPQCRKVLIPFEELYGVRITIPEYAEFCTAIGAALCYKH
jgi:type II pantothenate kinase